MAAHHLLHLPHPVRRWLASYPCACSSWTCQWRPRCVRGLGPTCWPPAGACCARDGQWQLQSPPAFASACVLLRKRGHCADPFGSPSAPCRCPYGPSLRPQSPNCPVQTRDNVFTTLVVSIQYQVVPESLYEVWGALQGRAKATHPCACQSRREGYPCSRQRTRRSAANCAH